MKMEIRIKDKFLISGLISYKAVNLILTQGMSDALEDPFASSIIKYLL